MKRKDKKGKVEFSEFMRYRGNNLTNQERYAFEKELQKDPFAEEAEEGFATYNKELLGKDMQILKKRLDSRTGSRQRRLLYYRIAASIAAFNARRFV